jgi:hypothetical protein
MDGTRINLEGVEAYVPQPPAQPQDQAATGPAALEHPELTAEWFQNLLQLRVHTMSYVPYRLASTPSRLMRVPSMSGLAL